jgi:hypothetical protein
VVHSNFLTQNADLTLSSIKPDGCTHHHKNKKNLVGKGKAVEGSGHGNRFGAYADFEQENLL